MQGDNESNISSAEFTIKNQASFWGLPFVHGNLSISHDLLPIMKSDCPSPVGRLIATNPEAPDLKSLWTSTFESWPHQIIDIEDAIVSAGGDIFGCRDTTVWGSLGCSMTNPIRIECAESLEFDSKEVIVITQRWGDSYFHALVEDLPRLVFVMNFRGIPADETHIHVADSSNNVLRNLVGFLGPWEVISGQIRARKVLLPPSTPCGGHIWSAYNSIFRSILQSRLILRDESLDKVLVVMNRDLAPHGRRILNHVQLVDQLRSVWVGTVIEHLGNEPFHDQLSMFYSAEAVLGPHGAGLSNIVTMRVGKSLVEFLPVHGVNKLNPCYMSLSFTLGLRYFTFYEPSSHSESNWEVTIPKVLRILRNL